MTTDTIYRTCHRKKRFPMRKAAREYLVYLKSEGVLTEFHRVYQCQLCRMWHVGRNMKKLRKHKRIDNARMKKKIKARVSHEVSTWRKCYRIPIALYPGACFHMGSDIEYYMTKKFFPSRNDRKL